MSGREASLGPALTQLLRGEQASWPRTLAAEEILERRDGAAALVVAWSAVLTRRVHDGRAEDQVEVLLPDGSSFDLARAESLLADKELERLYPPLRQPLNKATRPFRRFAEQRFELIQAIAFDDDIIADDDKKRLADFLDSTIGEMTACRELLASLGGVELGDQEAVTRGLDLPAPALFAATQLLALVRQALPALPARSLGVQRVSAPRRFTGHVVVDDADGADGTVRLWTAPCVTAGRFLAAARGAGRMLALAAHAPRHAPGLGLAVIDLDSRRALQESMGDARRAVQICVATSFLLARAHSAVALVGLRGLARDEEEEETRGALRLALGADGGADFGSLLLLPPLPDGTALRSPRRALLQQADAVVDIAASWLGLREAFDSGFLLRGRSLSGLRELPAAELDAASAWRVLLGEFL